MEKQTYLVLRFPEAGPAAPGTLGPTYRSAEPKGAKPAGEAKVEAQALDAQQYREARREPHTLVARPMPLKLIQPVLKPLAGEEPATGPEPVDGATWGVYVTGALQSPYAGYGVTVAVLDTGIDANHEAFHGVKLVEKDFTDEGNGDEDGHGTHVAGTIFGQAVGGVRIGVAPGVRRALIGKVLGRSGSTTTELVNAVQWAVAEGAHIINMSLGFDFPGLVKALVEQEGLEIDLATSRALAQYRDNLRIFDSLVAYLRARAAQSPSALIVSASGNESQRNRRADYTIDVAPPATGEGVLSVAALQTPGAPHTALAVAPFSNTGALVAGPGVDIYSARRGGGYTCMDGTSMASPHVAGVAALWAEWQINRRGRVDVGLLGEKLRSTARTERLQSRDYLDVGEGLVAAPAD